MTEQQRNGAQPLHHYDAAIAEQQRCYGELRRAALALLYLKAKLEAEGGAQRARVRWRLNTVQQQMTSCQKQLARLQNARLKALVADTCHRAQHRIETPQPATMALSEANLLAEAHAEIERHLR